MTGTPEFYIWWSMLARCERPNDRAYKNYGDRGITVCKAWHEFSAFFKDMGERPLGLTLERKNNDLGYCSENCCWATRKEQAKNRRPRSQGPHRQKEFAAGYVKTRKVYFSNSQSEFARKHKLIQSKISDCLQKKLRKHRGWKFKWL